MSDFDWRPMTGEWWMDLEPYPGPPHYEITASESLAAMGKAMKATFDPYAKAYEAFAAAFMKNNLPKTFPIPPRELNKPHRNYGPQPKRVFSHRGRKAY